MYQLFLKGQPNNDKDANQWLMDLFNMVGGLTKAHSLLSQAKSGQEVVVLESDNDGYLETIKKKARSRSLKKSLTVR